VLTKFDNVIGEKLVGTLAVSIVWWIEQNVV